MLNNKVLEVLREDKWSVAEGKSESGPYVIRFRTSVLGSDNVEGYGRALRIVWPYAEEDSGAMPTPGGSDAMTEFEDRLCQALESGAHALLLSVLTFDGTRQWVFYTGDVAECRKRLEAMPQNDEPYPIEVDAFDDPEWQYLRTQILGNVAYDA